MKTVNRLFILSLSLLVALGYSFNAYAASLNSDRTRAYSEAMRPHLILGGGKTNSTENGFNRLSVTADGNKMVFVQGTRLYLYDRLTDTSEYVYQSSGLLYDATISLDGSVIVMKERAGSNKILSYNVATKAVTVLNTSTKSFYGLPALSADGSLVSYAFYNGTKYVGILQNTTTLDKTVLDPAKIGKQNIDLNSDLTAAPVIVSHDGKSVFLGTQYDTYTNSGYIFKYDIAAQTYTNISGGQADAIHLGFLSNDDSKIFGMFYDVSRYSVASQNANGTGKVVYDSNTGTTAKLRGISGDGSIFANMSVLVADYNFPIQVYNQAYTQSIGGSSDGRILYFNSPKGIMWADISEIKDNLPNRLLPYAINDLTVTTSPASNVNTLNWTPSLTASYDDTVLRDGVVIETVRSGLGTYKDTTAVPGATYTYQVKAANASGPAALSNEVSGTTGGITAPVNVKATPTGRSTADITADAVPLATGYKLTVNNVTLDSPTPSFAVTGLTGLTTYTASMVAYNAGATSTTTTVTFKTLDADPVYAAPQGLFVMDQTATSLSLEWPEVSGASSYVLKRGQVIVYEGKNTTYTNTGLTPATSYLYSVAAKYGNATSPTASAMGKTLAAPSMQAPTGLKAEWIDGKVAISFDAVTGATSYTVKRGDTTLSSNSDRAITDAAANQPGLTYTYTVTATDGTSISSPASTTITVPVSKPGAVTGFKVATNAFNHVYLTWDAIPGASYTLKSQGQTLTQTSNSSYDDLSVKPETLYTYELVATIGGQTSDPVSVSVTTPAETIAYPKNLTVSEATYQLVRLKWSAVPGADGYDIYRNNMLFATVTDPSFTDERVFAGTSNVYGIKARKGSLMSEAAIINVNVPKKPVQGEAPAAPTGLKAVQIAAGYVKLQALTVTDATYYEFYRDDNIKVASGYTTAIKDDTVAPEQTYTYTVYAGNEFGRTKGDTITLTTPAEAPAIIIQPTTSNESYTINFEFKVVEDATKYQVSRNPEVTYTDLGNGKYRKTYYNTVTGETKDLGIVEERNGLLRFTEEGVTPASEYKYNITAIKMRNGTEEVVGGNEVSVTTPADGSPATVPGSVPADHDNGSGVHPGEPTDNTPTQPGTSTGNTKKDNDKKSSGSTGSGSVVPGTTNTSGSTGGGSGTGNQVSPGVSSDTNAGHTPGIDNGSTPAPAHPLSTSFTDVAGSHFASTAITTLAQAGIVKGYEDGTFHPNAPVTRAEFAIMITRAFDLQSTQGYQHHFADFNPAAWYAPELTIALNAGVTKGYDANRYAPGQFIPREQSAIMLTNVLRQEGMPHAASPAVFGDYHAITAWAVEAVNDAVANHIMNGYPDGSFKPHQNVTRAEAAQMIFDAKQAHFEF